MTRGGWKAWRGGALPYVLVALPAFQVVGITAMVVFGVIDVDDITEFGVIAGPLVATVASFSFPSNRN